MKTTHKAKFISIEGVEGAGKTTALSYIHEWLTAQAIDYVQTREPGGTPLAEEIRKILLGHYQEMMSPDTELLLMFAGRAQNIAQVILPNLRRDKWVISDRFTDASFAYQGGGRGVPIKHIEELAQWVQADLQPNLTFLLDLPVSVGLQRVKGRGARDRIECEGMDFFQRVREAYLQLAQDHPQRFYIINANQKPDEIKQEIQQQLMKLL